MPRTKSRQTTDIMAGAAYLGGREFTNRAGLSLTAAEQLTNIYTQQFSWFVEDQQTSFRKLGQTMNPLSVLVDHLSRRNQHVGRGAEQFFETMRELSTRGDKLRRNLSDAYANVTDGSREPNKQRTHEDILERLYLDHERVGRILNVIESLVNEIETLGPAELDRLVCCVDYIAEYPDAVHHPLEDQLFGHLLDLDLSEEARRHIEINAAKHEELTAATTRLAEDINAMLENRNCTPEELKPNAQAYIDLQRRHMAFEERHVFDLAMQQLKGCAWEEFEAESAPGDPLFDRQDDRFEALYQYVSGKL